MSKIRVLIVDDHAVMREGLSAAFKDDEYIEVIGLAVDGEDAIEKTNDLEPDIILMDINMPNLNGIEAAQSIKKEHPYIKVLLLTMLDSRQFVLEALNNNIDGYILKMADIDEVHKAIISIHEGGFYFDSEITEDLLSQPFNSEGDSFVQIEALTDREKEIINFIAQGLTTTEIAESLFITSSTVNNHRRNIMRKIKCKNTAELITYAVKSGIYKIN